MVNTTNTQFILTEEQPFSSSLLHSFILLLALLSFFTFIIGNILLVDYSTFIASISVEVIVLLIIFAIFSVAQLSRSLLWGVLAIFATLAISTFLNNQWGLWAITALGIYGFIVFIKNQHQYVGLIDRRGLLKSVIFGVLVIVSAKIPVSFDMLDRLELGNIHRDTLYHASIASMIKSYGVISTGLHGLIETPYHILSHSLFAAISTLSGIGVIEIYGLVSQLLFIPLLLCAIAYVASSFNKEKYYFKHFILTGFILAVAPRILKIWGLKESYFGSESYLIALILLTLSLSLLYKKSYRRLDFVLFFIALSLMTIAKASVGAIFIGLLLARIILFNTPTKKRIQELMLFLVSAAMLAYLLYPAMQAHVVYQEVGYWEFVKNYSLFGELTKEPFYLSFIPVLFFILMHFSISWATIKSRANTGGISAIFHDPVTFYSLAAVIGGVLVVMLPLLPKSTDYYFSSVALFVSLPWFIQIIANMEFPRIRRPYFTALLIVLIFKSTKLMEKTFLERDQIPQQAHVNFINTLINVRDNYTDNIFIKPKNLEKAHNPINNCASKPFIYPAVTEKAWLNIINLNNNCQYEYYGYSRYLKNQNTALVNPRVPNNVKKITVEF